MSQDNNRLIKCPYKLEKTWRVVKRALDRSKTEDLWWTIEEYKDQGLIRAVLSSAEELERNVILNVSIIENERKSMTGFTETVDFYEMVRWVEVRIDEDIYPSYKRTEKPEPIITSTQDCIRTALKIKQ